MINDKLSAEKIILVMVILIALGLAGYFVLSKNSSPITVQPTEEPTILPTSILSVEPTITPIIENDLLFSCGKSTVMDIDNNIYNTVKIGSQCWLKQNLKVMKSPTGELIIRYCFNNDPKICETDGGLYTWNIALNNSVEEGAQGICPNGWHVPRDSEWYILEKELTVGFCDSDRKGWGCGDVGTKLKLGGDSGFDVILTGNYNFQEHFEGRRSFTRLWSSSITDIYYSRYRYLGLASNDINRGTDYLGIGNSVRCLKD